MPPTLKTLSLKYIKDKMQSGEYQPGTRLSELALSREIGISRTPVREALNQLAAEGFVEFTPHAGAFIRYPDEQSIRELYELREVLESYAAYKCAMSAPPVILQQLQENVQGMEALLAVDPKQHQTQLDREQTKQQQECDLAFHHAVIRGGNNAQMEKVFVDFRVWRAIFSLMEPHMERITLEKTCYYHSQINRAIHEGDPRQARYLMGRHIRRGMVQRLRSFRRWQKDRPRNAHLPKALRQFA